VQMNLDDIKAQAQWELNLELFEKLIEEEKERLQKKRFWFPWRIKLINLNEDKS
jgi:hypothetical protein